MNKKTDHKSLLFYSFLIAYSAMLLFLAIRLNIWEDEAYSLHTTSHPLGRVVTQSYRFEGQPPCYFLILALWRKINHGIIFARLLSVLFTGLAAVYFYRLCRLITNRGFAQWLLVIFLINPFMVWASLEIRLYAFVAFLSLISVYYYVRYFRENRKRDLYLFLFFILVSLYTQYFFVFEIAAFGLSMLLFRGWKPLFVFCLYLLPVVILFLPNFYFLSSELKVGQLSTPISAELNSVLHSPQSLVFSPMLVKINPWLNRFIQLIVLAAACWGFLKLSRKNDGATRQSLQVIYTIAIVAVMVLLLDAFAVYTFGVGFTPRYMIMSLPLFMLLFSMLGGLERNTRNLVLAFLSVYYLFVLATVYRVPLKRFDYVTASKYVHRIERPGEPILLYSKILMPAFSIYYTGPDSLYSLPAANYDDTYYDNNITDTTQLKQALQQIPTTTHSYILVNGPIKGFRSPINMDDASFNTFLDSNYQILSDTSVTGEKNGDILRIRRIESKQQ